MFVCSFLAKDSCLQQDFTVIYLTTHLQVRLLQITTDILECLNHIFLSAVHGPNNEGLVSRQSFYCNISPSKFQMIPTSLSSLKEFVNIYNLHTCKNESDSILATEIYEMCILYVGKKIEDWDTHCISLNDHCTKVLIKKKSVKVQQTNSSKRQSIFHQVIVIWWKLCNFR